MSDRYAVMGNPIAHSRSPSIHTRFAAQTGEALAYEAILVEPGQFDAAVRRFRDGGGRGLNVTVPFKEDAFAFSETLSARARRAGAVNTLRFDESGVLGDNTDGAGLVVDLERNHGVALEGRRVLLVGAGGAARGVMGPLLDAGPASVVICNRTHRRAVEMAARFDGQGPVEVRAFEKLEGERYDVVVNATAAGLSGSVPPLPRDLFSAGGCGYDMVYGPGDTPFVTWCRANGAARSVDGLGMLVEQAAESFLLWRGVRPETAPVIRALRAELDEASK